MDFRTVIENQIEDAYRATFHLIGLVDDGELDWKPTTGDNWMTVGQLLQHLTESCGLCCRGFVRGEWGIPEDADPGSMLPPAEAMASVASVDEARAKLEVDKRIALEMVAEAGERLTAEKVAAPWNPTPRFLGEQLLDMVGHLVQHKTQLFYYLKLQGRPVATHTLYGM